MTTKFQGPSIKLPVYNMSAVSPPANQGHGTAFALTENTPGGSNGTDNVIWSFQSTAVEQLNSPFIFPGSALRWFKPGQSGTVSAATPTDGTMYLMPLWPNRTAQLQQLAFEITTQGVSASGTDVMRFGIYSAGSDSDPAALNGRPTGAALIDFGTSDLEAAAGVKVFDVSNITLAPKLYWLAVVRQTSGSIGVAAQVRSQVGAQMNIGMLGQTASTPLIGTDAASYGYLTQTGVTGALPTIGTLVESSGAAPVVLCQMRG